MHNRGLVSCGKKLHYNIFMIGDTIVLKVVHALCLGIVLA